MVKREIPFLLLLLLFIIIIQYLIYKITSRVNIGYLR